MRLIKRGASIRGARPAIFSTLVVAATLLVASAARSAGAAPPALTSRGACEAALAMEQSGQPAQVSSRAPCHSAFIVEGSPEDMRNEVASLMAPSARPSLDDLAVATLISEAAVRKAPNQPWGYLARCDIARSVGNADVLETCLADLARVAPEDAATTWARALATEPAPFAIRVIRILVLLVFFGTMADALLRRERFRTGLPALAACSDTLLRRTAPDDPNTVSSR